MISMYNDSYKKSQKNELEKHIKKNNHSKNNNDSLEKLYIEFKMYNNAASILDNTSCGQSQHFHIQSQLLYSYSLELGLKFLVMLSKNKLNKNTHSITEILSFCSIPIQNEFLQHIKQKVYNKLLYYIKAQKIKDTAKHNKIQQLDKQLQNFNIDDLIKYIKSTGNDNHFIKLRYLYEMTYDVTYYKPDILLSFIDLHDKNKSITFDIEFVQIMINAIIQIHDNQNKHK